MATYLTLRNQDGAMGSTPIEITGNAAHVLRADGTFGAPPPAPAAPVAWSDVSDKPSFGTASLENTGAFDPAGSAAAAQSTAISTAASDATTKANAARLGTAALGYATGAGGAVTQLTNKATGVTLNKLCGQITTHAAALAAGAEVSFVLTNSNIAATDIVLPCHASGGTAGAYFVQATAVGNGVCTLSISNLSAGSLSQAIVCNFIVIKAVAA
jgi:hypothetical protein